MVSDLSYPNAPDQPNLSGAGFQQPTFDLVNAYQVDENGLPMIDTYADHEFKNDQDIESSEGMGTGYGNPCDPRLDWAVGRRAFHIMIGDCTWESLIRGSSQRRSF